MRAYLTGFVAIVLSGILLFSVGARSVFAAATAMPTSTPAPAPSEVNSFDLFWPLVAGKTEGDSVYFLKQVKEKVRGLLIFGTPQKLDYNVLLAAKRVLEVEKLLKDGKSDLAKRTLESAQARLGEADGNLDSAKSSGQSLSQVSGVVGLRLSNIEKLVTWLATKNSDLKDALLAIGSKSVAISSKL